MFNESLVALQTTSVPIFYLHAADRSVPFVETLEAVNELHKQGKFETFALSNFTAFEVAEVVVTCKERGWVRPTLYQAMYNALSEFSFSFVFENLGWIFESCGGGLRWRIWFEIGMD